LGEVLHNYLNKLLYSHIYEAKMAFLLIKNSTTKKSKNISE